MIVCRVRGGADEALRSGRLRGACPRLVGQTEDGERVRSHFGRVARSRVMNDGDPRTDAELLAATPEDPDAFAAFYRRHVQAIARVAEARARPADVGDLVAEVFAAALVYRRRYDPARGSAGAWLTGIALNKLAQASRRGAVETKTCRRLGIDVPRFDIGDTEEADVGGELLAGLPAAQRRAVEARVLQDMSYAQLAREESVSEQVVRKRVSRALRTLRSRHQEER